MAKARTRTAQARNNRRHKPPKRRRVKPGELSRRPAEPKPGDQFATYIYASPGEPAELLHSHPTLERVRPFLDGWDCDKPLDDGRKIATVPVNPPQTVALPPLHCFVAGGKRGLVIKEMADPRETFVNKFNEEYSCAGLRAGLVVPEHLTVYELVDPTGCVVNRALDRSEAEVKAESDIARPITIREVQAVICRTGKAVTA